MNREIGIVPGIAAAILWAAVPYARAQQDAAPGRPTVGAIRVPALRIPDTTRLANGVRIVALPFGASPRAVVRIVLETGADAADCPTAAVLAQALQTGSGALQGSRLIDSVAHMGGAITVVLAPERIELTTEVLEPFVPAVVTLLGEIVTQPLVDEPTLRQASHDASQAAAAADHGLDAPALRAFQSMLFAANEFRSSCDFPREDPPSVDAVRRYYRERINSRRTTVFVVGRYDRQRVIDAATAVFSRWSPTDREFSDSHVTQSGSPTVRIVSRPGAKQVAIVVGARAPDGDNVDFDSFKIVDALLGGSLISRITQNIREAKGYAYGPTSTLASGPSGASYWAETSDVAATVAWPTVREILREIARLATDPPTMEEVTATERFVAGTTLLSRASSLGTLDDLERRDELARGHPQLTRSWAGDSTTPAAVQRLTAAYLSPPHLVVVVAADTTALGAQLDSIRHAVRASSAQYQAPAR